MQNRDREPLFCTQFAKQNVSQLFYVFQAQIQISFGGGGGGGGGPFFFFFF